MHFCDPNVTDRIRVKTRHPVRRRSITKKTIAAIPTLALAGRANRVVNVAATTQSITRYPGPPSNTHPSTNTTPLETIPDQLTLDACNTSFDDPFSYICLVFFCFHSEAFFLVSSSAVFCCRNCVFCLRAFTFRLRVSD